MSKRVRISNNSINSYGTRVLTAGMEIEQYSRNPVLLYMHQRGSVIGYVKDLRVEGDEITGELMFDEATELSQRCKKQYEFGSLKMVSVGIDILEMSEDKGLLLQGQTRPTVTRSKLFEVSLVDIGSNNDAIVLQKDGQRIELGKDGENYLPLLSNKQPDKKNLMDEKELLKQLRELLELPETTEASEILEKVKSLKGSPEPAGQEVEAELQMCCTMGVFKENEIKNLKGMYKDNPKSLKEYIRLRKNNFVEAQELLYDDVIAKKHLSHIFDKEFISGSLKRLALNDMETFSTLLERKPIRVSLSKFIHPETEVQPSEKPKSQWTLTDYRKFAPKELAQNPKLYKELIEKENFE